MPDAAPEKVRLLHWVVALYQDWGRTAAVGPHQRRLDSLLGSHQMQPVGGGG